MTKQKNTCPLIFNKTVLALLPLHFVFFGCSLTETDSVTPDFHFLSVTTKTINSATIYNDTLGCWLEPCPDVFEISNVQREYDALTHSSTKLSPTHYALRVIPPSEEAAYMLLSDTTMWVSAIPFGYRPVVTEVLLQNRKEKKPQETDQPLLSNGEDSIDMETPIDFQPLYVRWPVEKALPSDIEYEKLYEIYTPISGSQTDSLLFSVLLPNIQTRGERPDAGYHYAWQPAWNLKIKTFDEVLCTHLVMKKIHVKFMDYYSYYSYTGHTDNAGMVEVPRAAPMTSMVSLEFYTDDFIITKDYQTNCVSQNLGTLEDLADLPYTMSGLMPITTLEKERNFERQVYQFAWYYYHGSNELLDNISKLELDSPLRIATFADSTKLTYDEIDGIGWFFSTQNNPHIEIANYVPTYGLNISSCSFCTVLHELGHASHYSEMGYLGYSLVAGRIKESFASFMGWYNTREYYSSVISSDNDVNLITLQGRQEWSGTNDDNYTPIYIDLVDDYNQYLTDPSTVNDNISGIDVEDVLSFAIGPLNWLDSKILMSLRVGDLYSNTDFTNLTALY